VKRPGLIAMRRTTVVSRLAVVGVAIAVLAGGGSAAAAPAGTRLLYRIADDRIAEASGIAPGMVSPGVDYVENDSGDVNRFFALNARTGATAATITVPGARNVDWEDIAVAPDAAGTASVWLADIGDNDAVRTEVQVYRVDEPRIRPSDRGRIVRTKAAEVWRLRYPGGAVNAESFAVAPDGTGYLVTKSVLGSSVVYRLPVHSDSRHVQLLTRVGTVEFRPTGSTNPFGVAGQLTATSAAISRDGSVFAVRTYSDAYVWRLRSADVGAALEQPPTRVALPQQPQGEGIAVAGSKLLLDSEGEHSPVYAVPIPIPIPVPISTSSTSPTTSPTTNGSTTNSPAAPTSSADRSSTAAGLTPSAATNGSGGPSGWLYVGIAGAAAILLLVGWRLRRR
jgi:hypothetical protein